MKKIILAAAILALGFTTANAQYDPRFDQRDNYREDQRRDDHRDGRGYDRRDDNRNSPVNHLQRQARQQIADGIQYRSISSREASFLMNEYERIEALERRFSSHGRLSPRESRILTKDLERLMAQTRQLSSRNGDNWARGRNRY